MHMWVISIGRHMSFTFKKSPCLGQGSNRGPFDLKSSTVPRRYKSQLVPQSSRLYHVTQKSIKTVLILWKQGIKEPKKSHFGCACHILP